MASPNFGDTAFEGNIQPDTPIVEPVRDNSGIFLADGMASAAKDIGQGVGQAISFFGSAFANDQKAKATGVMANYQNDALLIADAVEQGLSVSAARMRLRSLNAQYLADNPSLQTELNDLHGTLVRTHGLAEITTSGNEEQQRLKKLIDDASAAGWVVPGDDPEEGVQAYLAAKRDVESLAEFKRKIEWKQAQRQEITEDEKWQATNLLKDFVLKSDPWVKAQIQTAKQRVEGGEDKGIVLQELEEGIGIELQKVGTLKAVGAEGDMSYLLDGVEKQVAAYKKWANGDYTTEAYEAEIKKLDAQNRLVLISDPTLGPLISASTLIGNTDPTLVTRIGVESARLFGNNARPQVNGDGTLSSTKPSDIIGQEKEIAGYLVPLQNAIENSVTNPSPEASKEVSTHITNLLRGVYKYGSGADDARDFRAVVEFFASPDVGKFAESGKGVIPQNVKDEATLVIQDQYEKVVLPLIRKGYEDALGKIDERFPELSGAMLSQAQTMVGGGTGTSSDKPVEVNQVIEPFWNGSGVEFKLAEGTGYEDNAQMRAIVKSLNTGNDSIAGPLNTLIRAKAHMQGRTDYENVYLETMRTRLWGQPDINTDGTGVVSPEGQDIDELGGGNIPLALPPVQITPPEGFSTTPSSVSGKTGVLLNAIGEAEGADYDTIYGYGDSPAPITTMTLNDLQLFQKEMVKKNGVSSAVGKYQILQTTLRDIMKGMGLKGDEVFTPQLQDQMAMWLLENRTDYDLWASGRGDNKRFQDQLASIWASIPNQSGKSAYAGDGINGATEAGRKVIGVL